MSSIWLGLPCARCDGKKGKKYIARKYCYRCSLEVKREQSRGAHARAIRKRYGIGPDDYNQIYEWQHGRCYICERATGRTKRLAVDHDHVTGRPRGLLCSNCNNMLGQARDDPEFFRRAIDYLEFSPFDRLGLYWKPDQPGTSGESHGGEHGGDHPAGEGQL